MFPAVFAMIADKAEGSVNGSHAERTHKGTKIALEDARKANWHMHALLYGLVRLLMDEVLGRPAKTRFTSAYVRRRLSKNSRSFKWRIFDIVVRDILLRRSCWSSTGSETLITHPRTQNL